MWTWVRGPLPLALCSAPESPRAQPAASIRLGSHRFRATRGGASISWLTADARMHHRVNTAGAGPPRATGFTSTQIGSRPGRSNHAKVLPGSKSTPSRIT